MQLVPFPFLNFVLWSLSPDRCSFNVMMDKQNLKQQFLRQNISCEALKGTVITSNLIQYLWDLSEVGEEMCVFWLMFLFS